MAALSSIVWGRGAILAAALLPGAACAPGDQEAAAQRPEVGESRALERAEAMLEERPAAEPGPVAR